MEWLELPGYITPQMLVNAWNGAQEWAYLDSSDTVNPHGRYSLLGFDPFLRLTYKNGRVSLNWKDGQKNCCSDPWSVIRDLLLSYEINGLFDNELPAGAAIGYMSYDLGMELESVSSSAKNAFGWPLMELAFYDLLFCFDYRGGPNLVVSTGFPVNDIRGRRKKAKERLTHALHMLEEKKGFADLVPGNNKHGQPRIFNSELESNFDHESYLNAIEKIRSYISAGDVYQVNLSQSFTGTTDADGWDIYQHIRQFNRVPFGGYLRFKEREILCFSMERFLRMQGKRVETRPIKGTRPRGRNKEDDIKLRRELFTSPKDRAELVMIVDMERNDLGKVCRPGTVRVNRLFDVEQYATVSHLVSTIRGDLEDRADHLDCIRACLPGGSITGAPKIRAMEIIDELEGIKREVYCGAIGYLGFNQVSDFNIPIRTIQKEGPNIRFNAGGGILYDSDPESEYQETLHKVRSFLECLSWPGLKEIQKSVTMRQP
ncbi:aminodeoxychorismate synthase component I [bacterium]|nr:aminodeoxychorismate synthase component I [bacterium]